MSIKLKGATSGSVELDVPAAVTGGDVSLSLPGAGTVDRLERAGNILQVVSTTKTDTASLSIADGVIDSSIVSGLSVNITPSSTSSKILILAQVACSVTSNAVFVYLVRGSTLICRADADGSRARASSMTMQAQEHYTDSSVINFLDSPSTTSQITYGIKLGHSSGSTRTVYVNRPDNNTNSSNYARTTSTITVMEVAG